MNLVHRVLGIAALLASGVAAQHLDASPEFGEVGADVAVILRSAAGEVVPGVAVRALEPGGGVVELGETDGSGAVRFAPAVQGNWEFHARLPDGGALLITPYHVEGERRRWLWALVCVPAGLVLLGLNVRRLRAGDGDGTAS